MRAPDDKPLLHNIDRTELIAAQITAAGIKTPPSAIIADGRIHRFASTAGHKSAAGWYIVHPDPIAATWAFGDWRLGIKERGEGNPGRDLTPEDIADRKERLRELQAEIEADKERFQAGAAIEARQRWDRSAPATEEHGYLKSKRIDPCGTRVDGYDLLVPMRDIAGKLWSLQEIAPDGRKHNQTGGRRKGCFFQIGEIGETVCVGEGFSTCATIYKATGFAVVSAGEAGNLESAARALREKYPGANMVICGDDDWLTKVNGKPRNVGNLAAQKAAKIVGGVLALPWFGPARPPWATDFNDMEKLSGLDEVATCIRLATVKHEEDRQAAGVAEPPPSTPEDFRPSPADAALDEGVTLSDLHAYMPIHAYIFAPTREMWPAASVNARVAPIPILKPDGSPAVDKRGKPKLISASAWLDRNRPVEQMTWAPGLLIPIPYQSDLAM